MPTCVRSKAMGLFMGISYLCNILIATCTLTVIAALGSGASSEAREKDGIGKLYVIFGVMAFVALAFVHVGVPETKGALLDDEDVRSEAFSPAFTAPNIKGEKEETELVTTVATEHVTISDI